MTFGSFVGTVSLLAALDTPYLLASKRLHARVLPLDAKWPRLVLGGAAVYGALAAGILLTGQAALIGFVAYATYNGTLFATNASYPVWLAALDTAWGTALCAATGWLVTHI